MFVKKEMNISGTWYEDFNFVEFHKDLSRKAFIICRRKFLENFSKIDKINEVQVIILKYITQLDSIIYYPEDNELMLKLNLTDIIKIPVKPEDFYELIEKSKK